MVSRTLMGIWAALDFFLLSAGVVAVALSIVWRAPNLLLNLVLSHEHLTAGTVLGIALLVTFVISIFGIVQRNHVTFGLIVLNWALILDVIGIIAIGTFVWYYTLQERNNFHEVYSVLSNNTIIQIQDKLKCCGYFNSSDFSVVGGSFCVSEDFIQNANNKTGAFCVGPVTGFADATLNQIFSTVYGFMAIVLCLLLASICVIKERNNDERFKKIDAKRGGRGFV